MNKKCSWIAAAAILAASFSAYAGQPRIASSLNIKRFSGRWFNLASLPMHFQKRCYCSQFFYTLEDDGDLQLGHGCYKGSKPGKWKYLSASAGSNFGPNKSQFKVPYYWPFRKQYWVLYVSNDYKYAIVGTPNYKYAWIMSRQPHATVGQFLKLKGILKARGYDVKKLQMMEQSCGMKHE